MAYTADQLTEAFKKAVELKDFDAANNLADNIMRLRDHTEQSRKTSPRKNFDMRYGIEEDGSIVPAESYSDAVKRSNDINAIGTSRHVKPKTTFDEDVIAGATAPLVAGANVMRWLTKPRETFGLKTGTYQASGEWGRAADYLINKGGGAEAERGFGGALAMGAATMPWYLTGAGRALAVAGQGGNVAVQASEAGANPFAALGAGALEAGQQAMTGGLMKNAGIIKNTVLNPSLDVLAGRGESALANAGGAQGANFDPTLEQSFASAAMGATGAAVNKIFTRPDTYTYKGKDSDALRAAADAVAKKNGYEAPKGTIDLEAYAKNPFFGTDYMADRTKMQAEQDRLANDKPVVNAEAYQKNPYSGVNFEPARRTMQDDMNSLVKSDPEIKAAVEGITGLNAGRKINKGFGGKQSGAVDMDVFKEGGKKASEFLSAVSRLTDKLRGRVPFPHVQNQDGSPKIVFHGTNVPTEFSNLKPGVGDIGVHLGEHPAVAPSMFWTRESGAEGRLAAARGLWGGDDSTYMGWKTKPNPFDHTKPRVYPYMIKEGNYPFIKDMGVWNNFKELSLELFLKRHLTPEQYESITKQMLSRYPYLDSEPHMAKPELDFYKSLLKNIAKIDGFQYANDNETFKSQGLYYRIAKNREEPTDVNKMPPEWGHARSWVIFDPNNVVSLYDNGAQKTPLQKKQGGYINFWGAKKTTPADPADLPGFDRWKYQRDPKVAIEQAKVIPDIPGNRLSRTLRHLQPGARHEVVNTNNPIVKAVFSWVQDATVKARHGSAQWVNQLNKAHLAMTPEQRIEVSKLLLLQDRNQMYFDNSVLGKLAPAQRTYMNLVRESLGQNGVYGLENKETGPNPGKKFSQRDGYSVPGNFGGGYQTLIVRDVPNKDGKGSHMEVVENVNTSTRWGHDKLVNQRLAALKKDDPNLRTYKLHDKTSVGNAEPGQAFNNQKKNLLAFLMENDPEFANKYADLVAKDEMVASRVLLGYDKHAKAKKGITGSEGDKPWRTAKENSDDMHNNLVNHISQAYEYYNMRDAYNKTNKLLNTPEIQENQKNAIAYSRMYVESAMGGISDLGKAFNTALDALGNSTGFGGRNLAKGARIAKNEVSHNMMGYLNMPFFQSQLLQPVTSGEPFIVHAAKVSGIPVEALWRAHATGPVKSTMASLEWMAMQMGKKLRFKGLDDFDRASFAWAKERGLTSLSEMEAVREAHKSQIMQAKDEIAEFNIKMGEILTRPTVYQSFVQLLKPLRGKLSDQDIYEIAENFTQYAMIDYNRNERPLLYRRLGVVGEFAGGLRTYMHGYVGQQVTLMRDAGKGLAKGDLAAALPLMTSMVAQTAIAGLTGWAGFETADDIIRETTKLLAEEDYMKRPTYMKEYILDNMDKLSEHNLGWIGQGLPAYLSGTNINNKLSMGDIISGNLSARALSPHAGYLANILGTVYSRVFDGTPVTKEDIFYIARSMAPPHVRGAMDVKYAMTDQNQIINSKGEAGFPMTKQEKYVYAATGMRPNWMDPRNDQEYTYRTEQKGDANKRTEALKAISEAVRLGNPIDDHVKKFKQFGGEEKNILPFVKKELENRITTPELRRLQGNINSAVGLWNEAKRRERHQK